MDRTVIVPYRAEEKELSHTLYSAIQGLMLLYPPTEELKKCLSDEMFIKPNQNAFFHVMHYLFRIFDAQEFKKRFFWPITDKRSESSFRNSTVEYLKHINEKYQLNWTNIKSYLVVMPGGMKFISFLIDFVNFIVQELVKQKEKQLYLDANSYRPQVSEANLHKICARNEFFKAMASEFIDALENVNAKYDEKSEHLKRHLEKLSEESGLNADMLIDEQFLESFENSNCQLFDKCYNDRSSKVAEMDHLINELKEAMDRFYSKETGYKYDKQRISQQLKRIRDNFPDELVEDSFGHKVADDDVNINTLISTFNVINETIQSELKAFNKMPCAGEFVYSRLLTLKKELQDMELQITNFKKVLNESMKMSKTDLSLTPVRANANDSKKRNLENTLLMKLVSTPPIRFELPEDSGKSRLALVDSKCSNSNDTTLKIFFAPPRSMAIRQPARNNSFMEQTNSDSNNMNRSKIIDPMQLLRSSSKKDATKYKSACQLNLSNLGSKWKQQQSLFTDHREEDNNPITSIIAYNALTPQNPLKVLDSDKKSPQVYPKSTSPTILIQSPFTPFTSNDRTQIAKSHFQLDSSIIAGLNSAGSVSNVGKKLSAVKKVQDASLNFANLSTSPSGRLDPLVTADDIDIPKLKLNDISLIEQTQNLFNPISEHPKPMANDENDPNAVNVITITQDYSTCKYEQEEDALFNISDSVLNDVTL